MEYILVDITEIKIVEKDPNERVDIKGQYKDCIQYIRNDIKIKTKQTKKNYEQLLSNKKNEENYVRTVHKGER